MEPPAGQCHPEGQQGVAEGSSGGEYASLIRGSGLERRNSEIARDPTLDARRSSSELRRRIQLRLQAPWIDLAALAGRKRAHAHFGFARESEEDSVGEGRSGRRHLSVGAIGRRAVVDSPELAVAADEEDRRKLLNN